MKDRGRTHQTGVSLHGHTWHSLESLSFLPKTIEKSYILPYLTRRLEKRHLKKWQKELDYSQGYWISPVSPETAYMLETKQIKGHGLARAFVSITDHNEIAACKDIISLEWTAPHAGTAFHVGIHNLPAQKAPHLLEMLRATTALARSGDHSALHEALRAVSAFPETLVVLNHPLVDQGRIGHEMHASLVREFLGLHGRFIHALELNALQPKRVNRRVVLIAKERGLPLISGGDRHGFEPNGAINLTNAPTFADFVHEVRYEKKSEILFMPQYRESVALRYAKNVEVIMAKYPALGPRARWHDRVFYTAPDGVTRSLTEMMGKRSRSVRTVNWLVRTLKIVNSIAEPLTPVFSIRHSKAE